MMQDEESDGFELTEKQAYALTRRLCHFAPSESEVNLCNAFHEFLVLQSMVALGLEKLQPSDIKNSIKNLFGLDFELREVEIRLEDLCNVKKVIHENEKYWLDYQIYKELQQSAKDCEIREIHVIDNWLKSMEVKYPELSQEDLQRLENDLNIFVAQIFIQHGVECANFISPKQEKMIEAFDNQAAFLSEILPDYPVLAEIRCKELPAFFCEAEGERSKYIAEMLDASFMIHAIQIDKTCSALIAHIFKGHLLYLDTNIIYALLDLDTPRETTITKRLIEISQNIGYKTVISSKTLEEFKDSLSHSEKHLKKYPEMQKDIAKVAANHSESGFISAYRRQSAKWGISVEDFLATYRNYGKLLAHYKIEVRDDFCAKIQEDPELQNQIDLVYASTDPYFVEKNVAEHDAFHRLLIKKVRGKKAKIFSEATAWFLTYHKKLPIYDCFARSREKDGLSEVPFCILGDDWLQFIRPLLPRSEDFDKTFVNLISCPELRAYDKVPSELAEKIIGRITRYKDYTPDMVARILTDSHFIQSLKAVQSETNQVELIDNRIVASAEAFQLERDYYKERFREASKSVKYLEKTKKMLRKMEREQKKIEDDLEKQKVENIVIDEKYKSEIEKIEQNYGNKMEQLGNKYEQEIEMLRNKFKSQDNRKGIYIKWLITGIVWYAIVTILLLLPWDSLTFNVKLLVAIIAVIASLLAPIVPLGWGKTYKIFLVIGSFAHIVLLTVLVVQQVGVL